jgi:hypothetical protein
LLVYGDREHTRDVAELLDGLAASLRAAGAMPPGLARHEALVAALIEAGGLVQGLADAALASAGHDATDPATERAMVVLMALAASVRRSWRSGFAAPPLVPPTMPRLRGWVRIRRTEGFAFYALYPEAYQVAAAALPPVPGTQVLGLRSIGTTLGAVVADALFCPVAHTLRPVGHPFARRLALGPGVVLSAARVAVVDEGPGLSGSSFGAVLEALAEHAVAPHRIHVFSGHLGAPGPQASARHRTLLGAVNRHALPFATVPSEARLAGWVADLFGTKVLAMRDISGGAWRNGASLPAFPQQERRKFLLRMQHGTWLAKFVGLGAFGAAQVARAKTLAAGGFVPEVAGACHGFLVERWLGASRPAPPDMLTHLGRYLGFRARMLPAGPEDGATMGALWDMAQHNAAAAGLGALLDWRAHLPALERTTRRVWTDSRLHRWEWHFGARTLKTDAVDHAGAHDLVGAQDIAWDIAGAAVEWGVDPATLSARVAAEGGKPVPAAAVAFFRLCYPAFQLGLFSMAADATGGTDRRLLLAEAERYRAALIAAGKHPGWPAG